MTLQNQQGVALLVYLNNIALTLLKMAGLKPKKDTFADLNNKVEKIAKVLINKSEK